MKRHGSGTKDKVFTTWNVMSKFNPENSAGNWFTIIYDLMLHNQFSVKSNQSCKILISVVYSNGVMIWELSRKYLSWLHDYSGSRATWSLRDIKRRCISGCGSLNFFKFSELNEKKTVIGWVMKSPTHIRDEPCFCFAFGFSLPVHFDLLPDYYPPTLSERAYFSNSLLGLYLIKSWKTVKRGSGI